MKTKIYALTLAKITLLSLFTLSSHISLSQNTLAQTLNTGNDCRLETPIIALRKIPRNSAQHLQNLSQHFISLVASRKRALFYALGDQKDSYSLGTGPWINLQHAFSQKIKRSASNLSRSSSQDCLSSSSPTSLSFGLDLVNTDGFVAFTLGIFGGYENNQATISSINSEGQETSAFQSFSVQNNALRYGAYAAAYGDTLYGFISYTQNQAPVSVTTHDKKDFQFYKGGFGSIGGGIGFAAHSGISLSSQMNAQYLSTPSEEIAISYDSNLQQSYTATTPNWLVAETRVDIGFPFGDENSLGNASLYASSIIIANTGDDSFKALGNQGLQTLQQYLQQFFTNSPSFNINDAMVYGTLGFLINYGNLNGLKGGLEFGYSQRMVEGASLDNDSSFIKLNLDYRF